MPSGGTFGLAGAPVTKLWLATIGLASASLTPMGKVMPFRRLLATLAFGDFVSMLVALNLVFQMRSLERIYGSRRFASHLVASLVVSRTLLVLLRHFGLVTAAAATATATATASRGPYDLLTSCLLQFFIHVPATRYMRRWGMGIGDNWMMLPWLVFVVGRRTGAAWCALAGAVAALVVENNVAGLKSWRLPSWMGKLAARMLKSKPAGSVLQSGGQQQMEAIRAAMAQAEAEADEQQVSLLMSMFPGTERTQIAQALQLASNDANRAVTILLDGSNARAPPS
ncbi:hypothetical protein LPJ64_004995 [Coemansia asiatica]|uniref:CUE domain-containing protein n=1 Tax=Coemansia asiatica TaxID=1052880 RepID=A0A9W8CI20_9FUNG|nr:hypothetical protein LPJ64_004995 [Coemansia asiatica]